MTNSRGLSLNIDLGQIRRNYLTIEKQLTPNAQMAAVVKADCYGLGMQKIAPLFYEQGCRHFFVARIGEALELKNILLKQSTIYIFDGLTSKEDADICKVHGFTPILNAPEEVLYAGGLPVGLHFDTGMNRLGLNIKDIDKIKRSEPDIRLVMSHPANAEDPHSPQTEKQFEVFSKIRESFPDSPASFANSAATFKDKNLQLDLVRPGIALYGGESLPHAQTGIRDTISLSAPILQLRHIDKGETVGYGADFKARAPMQVATLGIGYADGFFRCLDKGGSVYINDRACPVIGRVSMDLITVDVTHCPCPPAPGDKAEIIGNHISLDDYARKAGTIGYDVLTRLGKSIEKCYS